VDPRVRLAVSPSALSVGGRLLDAFNTAYDDPSPGPEALGLRLGQVVAGGATDVLLGLADPADDPLTAVGVAVVRYRPSLWSTADEAYLAELWVDPSARGAGLGRALLRACLERARDRGCDWLDLATSEDDVAARALYESEGLRGTEGAGGPVALHYEIEL
jgi:ribosomal protein S18 acetylase RimI-like enzyme